MIFIHIQGFGSVSGRIRCFCLDLDPVFLPESRFDFQISPDPVYPERLDPDPVNIRPDPKPYDRSHISSKAATFLTSRRHAKKLLLKRKLIHIYTNNMIYKNIYIIIIIKFFHVILLKSALRIESNKSSDRSRRI